MKFLRKKILIALLFIFVVNLNYAQDSIHINLNTAVRIALNNNTDITIAEYSVETAEYARKEATGSVLPKLFLSANYFRNIDRPVIFLPDVFGMTNTATKLGSANDYRASLNMAVPIYSNHNQNNKKLTETRLDYQKELARYTRQQVVNATKKSYFNYLVAQEIVKVQQIQLQNAEDVSNDIGKRWKQGALTDHDLTAAKVQVTQAKSNLLEVQNNIMPLANSLKLLLGFGPNDNIKLTESIETIEEELALDINNAKMLEDNSILKQLKLEVELNKNQIRMAKSVYYPSLEAIGNYNYQAQEEGFDLANYQWVNTSLVGLQLQFSIFNGNITKNRVKQAEIGQSVAEDQKEYTVRAYQMKLQELISKLDFASRKIAVQLESMNLTEDALGLARKRYNFGVGTFLEVNNAILSYTQARLIWLQAISEYKTAYYDYQLLIGED